VPFIPIFFFFVFFPVAFFFRWLLVSCESQLHEGLSRDTCLICPANAIAILF
jgi:hypothetical protein